MKTLCSLSLAAFAAGAALAGPTTGPEFTAPTRLQAAGEDVRVESPGYAFPAWHDVTGDGVADLVVGQFRKGRIKVYPGLGEGKLGAGNWLEAEGKVAEVPGVW